MGCGSCGTPLHDQVYPGPEPGRKGQWEGARRGQGGLFSEFCFSEALGPVPQFGENGVNPKYWGAVLGRVHLFLPSLLLPSFGNIQRPNFLTLPLTSRADTRGLLKPAHVGCCVERARPPCRVQATCKRPMDINGWPTLPQENRLKLLCVLPAFALRRRGSGFIGSSKSAVRSQTI